MNKDAGVAMQMANINKIDMPLGEMAQNLLQDTIKEFGLNADMSEVAITYEKKTGTKIRP